MTASGRRGRPLPPADLPSLLSPFLDGSRPDVTGVVLAVSGGPDSVALMRLAAGLRPAGAAVPVAAATVDHGLRPGSREEASAVAAWAGACGLPHHRLDWEERPASRVHERAREARYRLLASLAQTLGASHVLTAHTLDDQAETVLMRLSRGTGIGGLAGMRCEVARHGIVLARPFLGVRKAALLETCREEGWPFVDDPSNADPRFARARFRRVMPLLAAEGLTPERLAALADRARRAEDALDRAAEAVAGEATAQAGQEGQVIDGARLLGEPEAVFLRVIGRAIAGVAARPTRPVRLERLERTILGRLRPALAEGRSLRLTMGGALIEVRTDRRVRLRPEPPRRRGLADSRTPAAG